MEQDKSNADFHQVVESNSQKIARIQKEVSEFIADPENRKKATELAIQIQDICGKNWFSFKRFLRKTREEEGDGLHKLNLLRAFDMLLSRGSIEDAEFKVVVSRDDKINAITAEIDEHIAIIDALIIKRQQLEAGN